MINTLTRQDHKHIFDCQYPKTKDFCWDILDKCTVLHRGRFDLYANQWILHLTDMLTPDNALHFFQYLSEYIMHCANNHKPIRLLDIRGTKLSDDSQPYIKKFFEELLPVDISLWEVLYDKKKMNPEMSKLISCVHRVKTVQKQALEKLDARQQSSPKCLGSKCDCSSYTHNGVNFRSPFERDWGNDSGGMCVCGHWEGYHKGSLITIHSQKLLLNSEDDRFDCRDYNRNGRNIGDNSWEYYTSNGACVRVVNGREAD